MIQALYVHVPFCQSICAYCDFTRVGYHPKLVRDYLDALSLEIRNYDLSHIDTLYIGGGTPTALNVMELSDLFDILRPYTSKLKEATIEINPETLDKDKIALMKDFGINRVSLGVQSFIPEDLRKLDRKHTNERVYACIEQLREAGIDNISLDLMYALPHQTLESFESSLKIALGLPITHLSIYALTIEEHSTWGRAGIKPVPQELEEVQYRRAIELCEKAGFSQYEISNFSKGQPSLHNTHYWHYDDYAGLGPGAVGMVEAKRLENTDNLLDYSQGKFVKETVQLSEEDRRFERIMMGLRLKAGIDLKDYETKTGHSLLDLYPEAIRKNLDKGLIILDDNHMACTEQGYGLLHDILVDFLD